MGFLGTRADWPTDMLILGEIGISILVYIGVRTIKANKVARHRTIMLTTLALNLTLLVTFLITDVIKAQNTVKRGLTAPLWLFLPLLAIHLAIAVSSLTIAIWAWRIARKGVVRDGQGVVVNVTPDVRRAHRRISIYYPRLWYSTLATGLLLYATIYIVQWPQPS